jgi:hypothetical protein
VVTSGAGGAPATSGGPPDGSGASASAGSGGVAGPGGAGGSLAAGGAGGAGGRVSAGGVAATGGTLATGGAPTTGSTGHDGGADAQATSSTAEGDVHLVKRMGDPSFDAVVTNPSPATVTWLGDHFYRMEVFTTFFDDKTSFYPEGWVYSDSAAIYVGSSTAAQHPSWILKDTGGKSVYLDWGCSGGACPQYAADVSNAEFRSWWIDALKSALQKGYAGAWIDDVNLALRFTDGTKAVTAHSPTTQVVMTEDAWSAAVASFMTEIRAKVSGYELLHNSVWYARPTRAQDTYVQEEIGAADVINLEGGFASDGGLTGGTAEWSVFAKMAFVDAVHAAGRWVVIDDFPASDLEREYALACYFLVTNGRDGLGDAAMAPATWWKGYDVHLGRALAARTRGAGGVFRRDFERGLVLALEPGATGTTVSLPGPYLSLDGTEVTQVTLSPRRGAVLVKRTP